MHPVTNPTSGIKKYFPNMTATTTSLSAHPTHDPNGNLLPALLCLHGGGSNSTVFKIQCRRLIRNLGSQFRFVYAQAPIEGTPGFGMLPVFESCAPFYKWVSRRFVIGEAEKEVALSEEVKVLDGILRKVMEENGGVESFVGIIGFSQGARITAGLLLRQLMAERDRVECWTRFRFGVMIGGPYPPIALDVDGREPDLLMDYSLMRMIPTVHAWGDKDHVKEGCFLLADMCDGDVCFQMEFEGAHHLPLKDNDARDLCDLIMAAWFAAGGRRLAAAGEKY